jgi:hypothetical protein
VIAELNRGTGPIAGALPEHPASPAQRPEIS